MLLQRQIRQPWPVHATLGHISIFGRGPRRDGHEYPERRTALTCERVDGTLLHVATE